ncbi:MAG: hypothetical protein ACKOEG_05495, partial [Chthoniobacterales bacterium]
QALGTAQGKATDGPGDGIGGSGRPSAKSGANLVPKNGSFSCFLLLGLATSCQLTKSPRTQYS